MDRRVVTREPEPAEHVVHVFPAHRWELVCSVHQIGHEVLARVLSAIRGQVVDVALVLQKSLRRGDLATVVGERIHEQVHIFSPGLNLVDLLEGHPEDQADDVLHVRVRVLVHQVCSALVDEPVHQLVGAARHLGNLLANATS
jgi:hypothetical protein